MCGLVGIACKTFTQAKADAFSKMVYMDTLRGFDSTGVAVGYDRADGEQRPVRYYKRALAGPDYLPLRGYKRMFNKVADVRFCMGHNRAATKGSVTDENAHPFAGANIILAHNGSLDYHTNLVDGTGGNYDVDSEAIMHHLDMEDDVNLPEAISEIHGAFSLTWYDMVEDALYFVRNDERPMYFARVLDYYGKEQTGLMWSSVPEFITYVAAKHAINITEPESTKVGTLYKFTADGSELISEREVAVHEPKKYNSWSYMGSAGSTSHGGSGNAASSRAGESQKSQTTANNTNTSGTSGGTQSQTGSGKTSHPSGQTTTSSKDKEPAGGPHIGHFVEFAVYASSYIGGDTGQQTGWMKASNGRKYVVCISNVPRDGRINGIFRARVLSRYNPISDTVLPSYSTHRLRVEWSQCKWLDTQHLAEYNSAHITANFDDTNRDGRANAIDLSTCFPKGRSELVKHRDQQQQELFVDKRRFAYGSKEVSAYDMEALLVEPCVCCDEKITRDQIYDGSASFINDIPVHCHCADNLMK